MSVAPTFHDAAKRSVVTLPDHRTARLVFVARKGNTARVQLESGAFLSVKADSLKVEES